MSGMTSFVVVPVDATGLKDGEVEAYAAAQQHQLLEHWFPEFGTFGTVRVGKASDVRDGEVEHQLLAKPTQDGALGFHDQTPDGTPIIFTFVDLARSLGELWTTVGSHETLETMGDKLLRLCVQMPDGFWDYEVCDRVEQSKYLVGSVWLSNFNTRACFEPPPDGHAVKYDYLGLSKKANEVLEGGYAQRFDPKLGWQSVGKQSSYRQAVAHLSRSARRRSRVPFTAP
jgi:hypothetical protein